MSELDRMIENLRQWILSTYDDDEGLVLAAATMEHLRRGKKTYEALLRRGTFGFKADMSAAREMGVVTPLGK